MTNEAPTPEEIANECWSEWNAGHISFDLTAEIRAYGDRRYCEARDAAVDKAEMRVIWEEDDGLMGRPQTSVEIVAAIRKLAP